MAISLDERYQSVSDFQDALVGFLQHEEAIKTCAYAAELLLEAQKTDEYENYQEVVYQYRLAADLWPDYNAAVKGSSRAHAAFAQCALDKGDLELALKHVDDNDESHLELLAGIQAASKLRAQRIKRMRQMRLAAGSMAAVLLLAFVFMLNEYYKHLAKAEHLSLPSTSAVSMTREVPFVLSQKKRSPNL